MARPVSRDTQLHAGPARPPRRKACHHCAQSKVRCSLARPTCTRCRDRELSCSYPDGSNHQPSSILASTPSETLSYVSASPADNLAEPGPSSSSLTDPVLGNEPRAGLAPNAVAHQDRIREPNPGSCDLSDLNLGEVDLVCTVDPQMVRDRWIDRLLSSNSRVKHMSPLTIHMATSVLKTYPKMCVREDSVPPIIHRAQVVGAHVPEALANCFNIARLMESQIIGSENMVRGVLEKEMARIMESRHSCNQLQLLASLQAYLIYAIMIYFHQVCSPLMENHDVMMQLQELSSDVAGKGTLCHGEISGSRPDWEAWIIASAKRRTLFAAYMFDNIITTRNGIPCITGVELASLPAPASKTLWEASTRQEWNRQYNLHLGQWNEGEFLISELWKQPGADPEVRQKRIEDWLASVDDFGMMIYAVTVDSHGP